MCWLFLSQFNIHFALIVYFKYFCLHVYRIWTYFVFSLQSSWLSWWLWQLSLLSLVQLCTDESSPRRLQQTCWEQRNQPGAGKIWSRAASTHCSFVLAEIQINLKYINYLKSWWFEINFSWRQISMNRSMFLQSPVGKKGNK